MIEELCNPTGQEHILVNYLEVNLIHDKMSLYFLRIQLIFNPELLLLRPYHP